MKLRKKLLMASLTLAGFVSYVAAMTSITGSVIDTSGEALIGATVKVLSMPDSTLKEGVMTDLDGRYTLSNLAPGNYLIDYSMVGLKTSQRTLSIPDSLAVDTLHLEPVTLSETSIMLQEAVVSGVKAAVVAKEDTLEYNAGSFKPRTNSTVEDLLKKLPGVEVSTDGSITSGGKSITKVYVDGKEFFGDDPQMATKNLPSEMIDKVQVVTQKSDLARMTGVDDGEEETVINLTVKKNMRNGWFGNVSAGYGTDHRYSGSFNVNRFQNGNQFTILGGGNNTNEIGFTDRGRGRFHGFGGDNGINSSQRIGVNFNVGRGDSLRFGGNIMYSHTDRDAESLKYTQYLFPDSVSYQDAWSKSRDRGHNINADFRLQWKIDAANTLDFRPRFSFSRRLSASRDTSMLRASEALTSIVNRNDRSDKARGTSYEIGGELIFNHNFLSHPGRSLSVQAKYSFSDTRNYSNSFNQLMYYLAQQDDENLYQYINNHQWSNTVEGRLTWTEPLGNAANGNYLTVAYRTRYAFNNADKLTYEMDPDTWTGSLPTPGGAIPYTGLLSDSLSNRFRNNFFTQELQVGYKKVNKMYNLETGITFSPSSSSSKDLINSDRNIPTRWVWNVAPFLRFRYKFNKQTSLSARYNARTSSPSLTALQPVADTSDPLNITIGNPDLKPSFTQNVMLHFNSYNTDAQRSIFAAMNASYTLNNVVSSTMTDPSSGVRTTTYENVSGDWHMMFMGMLTQPFANRHWRFNVRMMGRYQQANGFINGLKNRSGSFMLSPQAGITYSADIFQFTLSPTYSLQLATNSLANQPNRTVHSYGFTADATLQLPFGLEVASDLNMSKSSGYASGFNTQQWLWNAQISYSFLKNKSLTAAIKVYDILQQKRNITRAINAGSIVDSRINDLTRYAMLTLTYTFNSFGSRDNIPQVEGSRHGDHPGPPPGAGRPPMR